MDRTYPDGRKIHLGLLTNPCKEFNNLSKIFTALHYLTAHLEYVNPIVLGKARAKQTMGVLHLQPDSGKRIQNSLRMVRLVANHLHLNCLVVVPSLHWLLHHLPLAVIAVTKKGPLITCYSSEWPETYQLFCGGN
jgi:hypothetical protein